MGRKTSRQEIILSVSFFLLSSKNGAFMIVMGLREFLSEEGAFVNLLRYE
jgi:hypothetical protein